MAKVAIILIGNELLNGDISDLNARYFLAKYKGSNISPTKIITLPDEKEVIISSLREHLALNDIIITSGGLGPTSDDITTECVALALEKPLVQDKQSLNRLEAKYKARNREVLESSLKQVDFPEGALVLTNEVGTADSFIANSSSGSSIISLPGVPKEFKFFIDGPVNAWINEKFNPKIDTHYEHFRLFGISEAEVGERIKNINLSKKVEALYRPQFPELLLSFRSKDPDLLKKESHKAVDAVGREFIYSQDPTASLSATISNMLREKHLTVSIAESCTGGLLSSLITAHPGASDIFLGSVVCYSNESKIKFLSVPAGEIERVGAVSPEVAKSMARGIRLKTGSTFGLSATGIAGPSNEGSAKPLGLIYLGFSSEEKEEVLELKLPWDREMNQRYAAYSLLNTLRKACY